MQREREKVRTRLRGCNACMWEREGGRERARERRGEREREREAMSERPEARQGFFCFFWYILM